MRRWLAILVGGLAIALVVVVVALRNAGAWVEANRDWVQGRIEESLGRSVSFGEVGIALFPAFAVRVADVRVGDDPAWSDAPFVSADAADVVVALLPALTGRVEVRRVVLESPAITVIRDERGHNVDSLGGAARGPTSGGEPPAAAPDREARGGVPAIPLAVGVVSISDGRVRMIDRRGDQETVVEATRVDVSLADLALDRAGRVDARAALLGAEHQNAFVEGTVGPLDREDAARTPLDLALRLERFDVDRLRALPELGGAVPAELAVAGPIDVTASVVGAVAAAAFDARIDATRAQLGWADAFAKAAGIPMVASVVGRRAGEGADVERLDFHLAALRASGSGQVSPERVAMRLEAAPASLAALLALLPALESWRTSGDVGFALDAAGPIGGGRVPALTGTVTLREVSVVSVEPPIDLQGLTQTIVLEGDAAELPATSIRLTGVPVTVSGRVENFAAPVVTARIATPGGAVQDLAFGESAASVRVRDRVATITDLDARVFDGQVQGRIEVDARAPDRPAFTTDLTMRGIDVAAAAGTRAPALASALAGRLSGEVAVRGAGTTWDVLRDALAGSGRLVVDDGVLRGVNLVERVLSGVTSVPGLATFVPPRVREKYPALFGGDDTRFDELSGAWRIASGVVHFDRLALAARDYSAEGRGTVSLESVLATTGVLELSEGLTGDLVGATEVVRFLRNDHGRVAVPFAVNGTWPRVRVTPDATALAQMLQRGAVRGGLDRLLGRDERRSPDGDGPSDVPPAEDLLRRGLERLFDR